MNNTLLELWSSSEQKAFLAQDTSGLVVLIQSPLNNGWFIGNPVVAFNTGYRTDGSSAILRSDEAIWSLI